jgi:CYTH domain-containing protein
VQFDALWPLAERRRVEKVRHLVPVGRHTAEVDLFAGALDGLCLVDVEFDDDEDLEAFEPPSWFGAEVTDDHRFSNAHLAVYGWEPRFDDLPT